MGDQNEQKIQRFLKLEKNAGGGEFVPPAQLQELRANLGRYKMLEFGEPTFQIHRL